MTRSSCPRVRRLDPVGVVHRRRSGSPPERLRTKSSTPAAHPKWIVLPRHPRIARRAVQICANHVHRVGSRRRPGEVELPKLGHDPPVRGEFPAEREAGSQIDGEAPHELPAHEVQVHALIAQVHHENGVARCHQHGALRRDPDLAGPTSRTTDGALIAPVGREIVGAGPVRRAPRAAVAVARYSRPAGSAELILRLAFRGADADTSVNAQASSGPRSPSRDSPPGYCAVGNALRSGADCPAHATAENTHQGEANGRERGGFLEGSTLGCRAEN
jgi:hypothetical protein